MGFQLSNIKQHQNKFFVKQKRTSVLQKEIVFFKKIFSNKVKEDFYTELSVLLKAGVNLKDALELLYKSQKKEHNKALVESLINSVIAGNSFSESIKENKIFTKYEYVSLKIGEETGNIAEISEQLGDFFARKNEQKRHLVNGLAYPIIIISTALLVVVFMLQFVVPIFQDIFKQQSIELPGITLFVISVSDLIQSYGSYFLVLTIILFLIYQKLKYTHWFKKLKDNILSKIPFFGNFIKTVYLSQFTQALTLLTASKVPLVTSINIVAQMIDFSPLNTALIEVEQELLKGKSFSKCIEGHNLFDDKMVALVKVGEETNQNEYIFKRLNNQYTTTVQHQSKLLSTIMEPFIIIIVGVFVGVIVIAMYLPMFKMSSMVG